MDDLFSDLRRESPEVDELMREYAELDKAYRQAREAMGEGPRPTEPVADSSKVTVSIDLQEFSTDED